MFDFEKELNTIFGNSTESLESDKKVKSDESVEFSTKYKITPKEAEVWLLSESDNKKSNRVVTKQFTSFECGKFYVFKYNAETGDKLNYWDRHPIALIFGSFQANNGNRIYVGLNVSWFPLKARLYFIKAIRKLYKNIFDDAIKKNPNNSIKQDPILLDLYKIKKTFDVFGFSFAIRHYKMENVINPIHCVCYEDWKNVIRIDLPNKYPQLVLNNGYSVFKIYLDYLSYLIKMRLFKNKHLRKMVDNKINGRYKLK